MSTNPSQNAYSTVDKSGSTKSLISRELGKDKYVFSLSTIKFWDNINWRNVEVGNWELVKRTHNAAQIYFFLKLKAWIIYFKNLLKNSFILMKEVLRVSISLWSWGLSWMCHRVSNDWLSLRWFPRATCGLVNMYWQDGLSN